MERDLELIIEAKDKLFHRDIILEWDAQELSYFSQKGRLNYTLGEFWKILNEKITKKIDNSWNKANTNEERISKIVKRFEDYILIKGSPKSYV